MYMVRDLFEDKVTLGYNCAQPRLATFEYPLFRHYIGRGLQHYTTMTHDEALLSFQYEVMVPPKLSIEMLDQITLDSWLAIHNLGTFSKIIFLFQSQDDAAFFQLMLS